MIAPRQKKESEAGTKKKRTLANKLERQMKAWNNKVVAEFKNRYPMTQLPSGLVQELENILVGHYFETAKVFSLVDLGKGIQKQAAQEISRVESGIARKVIEFIENDGQLNIGSITNTTEEILNEAVKKAQAIAAQSAEDNEPLTLAAIALIATRLLKNRLDGRLPVIGITETNWVSEGTKAIHVRETINPLVNALENEANFIELGSREIAGESAAVALGVSAFSWSRSAREAGEGAVNALTLVDSEGIILIEKLIKTVINAMKTWVTIGDARVRKTHQIANGQTVKDSLPFRVGGSLLMYPSDRSLGASTDQIVGCRCWASYT